MNNKGYWRYKDMVLQMEDCKDILSYMYPEYDLIFLFDHSNGHDRLQPNGLSVNRISIRHGGKQPVMRNSHITTELLGPYHNSTYSLQPGMEQSMIFSEGSSGPCYMSDQQISKHKFDISNGTLTEKHFTNSELVAKLKEHGLANPSGNRKKLVEQCMSLNIVEINKKEKNKKMVFSKCDNKSKGNKKVTFQQPSHTYADMVRNKNTSMSSQQMNEQTTTKKTIS